mmetsp:Transcript_45439/g.137742  ORF Transcript_45439/g.137742 Transcript_45439/m.137742 type:complete len:264 (+) Transcript_45439:172-963(+)
MPAMCCIIGAFPYICCGCIDAAVFGDMGTCDIDAACWINLSKASTIVLTGSGDSFSDLCPQAMNRSVFTSSRRALSTCGRICTVWSPMVISRRSPFWPSSPETCLAGSELRTMSRAAGDSMVTTAQPISLCFLASQCAPRASSGNLPPLLATMISASSSCTVFAPARPGPSRGPALALASLPWLLPLPQEAPSFALPLPLEYPSLLPPFSAGSPLPLPPFSYVLPLAPLSLALPLPPFAAPAPLPSLLPPMEPTRPRGAPRPS